MSSESGRQKKTKFVGASSDIALVGMACRFPGGVKNPVEFFHFLMAGGNGIVPIPPDRWDNDSYYDENPDSKYKMYVDQSGFIEDIDLFDPQFFGISPKEAHNLDPQHRWLLELTQEALENSGIKAADIRGSDTAVYIGQFIHDWEHIQADSLAKASGCMNAHTATGSSMTLTSNRISYTYDLTGPSVTLDTACSSSLVALDMACQAVLRGDSELAIAGGVNILLLPEVTMSLCRASMLSPDCRCKSFDASANGYVRSEGAGIVLVKKYEHAMRDGDPILAVIKGTGVNQDGQTKGITVPNGESQKKLFASTLRKSAMRPEDIQYFEAHGTGTPVGDPIEINAMGSMLKDRYDDSPPCIIGSVKSNIGHLEAAAGMAGLMKAVLALNSGIIPKNINFNKLNPAIPLTELNLDLALENTDWPDIKGQDRTALVNSFGYGGTNSNVILVESPHVNPVSARLSKEQVGKTPLKGLSRYWLTLSGKQESALLDSARSFRRFIGDENSDVALVDLCYTVACRRDHHKFRAVFSGKNRTELTEALDNYISGVDAPQVTAGTDISGLNNSLVHVFSGMGTQWLGMGRDLYETEPVFKEAMDKCDQALFQYSGWSLVEKLYNTPEIDLNGHTEVSQPAIFSVQVALSELLASWYIVPDMIVGHSAGEVAAAYVAGIYSFNDAIKIIFHRSQLQSTTEGSGKMLAVGLSESAAKPYLQGKEEKISIAAINSDDAITLAGCKNELEKMAAILDEKGYFTRFLAVGIPYHSPVMNQLRNPLIDALQDIVVNAPRIPIYSTVTGELSSDSDWGPEYWADNIRKPVLFKQAIEQMIDDGASNFVEVSSHPALSSSIEKCLSLKNVSGCIAHCLKRDMDGDLLIGAVPGKLHVGGVELPWEKIYQNGTFMLAPNYAWQHEKFWFEDKSVQRSRLFNLSPKILPLDTCHPLLGGPIESVLPIWQNAVSLNRLPFLMDHQIEEDVVYPGAAYVEMALTIAQERFGFTSVTLEDVNFNRAFFLSEEADASIESFLFSDSGRYRISAIDPQTDRWDIFSEGRISLSSAPHARTAIDIGAIKARTDQTLEGTSFYAHCHSLGLNYLARFQGVKQAWLNSNECLTEIYLPDDLDFDYKSYLLHPSILDAAFQGLFSLVESSYLPVSVRQIRYHNRPNPHCFGHLVMRHYSAESIYADVTVANENGDIVVELFGIRLKVKKSQNTQKKNFRYGFKWHEASLGSWETVEDTWLLVSEESNLATKLVASLREKGIDIHLVHVENYGEEALLESLRPFSASCNGVLYLPPLSTSERFCKKDIVDNAFYKVEEMCNSTLQFFQAFVQVEWKNDMRLKLLTENSQSVLASDDINPLHAPIWGMGRTLESEYPHISVSMCDVDNIVSSYSVNLLTEEMRTEVREQEIAFREGVRYVQRLEALTDSHLNSQTLEKVDLRSTSTYRVVGEKQPELELVDVSTPSRHEVKINIRYVFHTSLEEDSPLYVCSATVADVGKAVSGLKVGDKIITLITEIVSSICVTTNMLSVIPENMSPERACVLVFNQLRAVVTSQIIKSSSTIKSALVRCDKAEELHALANSDTLIQSKIYCLSNTLQESCTKSKVSQVSMLREEIDWPYTLYQENGPLDVVLHFAIEKFDLRLISHIAPFGTVVDWSEQILDDRSLGILAANQVNYLKLSWSGLINLTPEKIGCWINVLLSYHDKLSQTEKDIPTTPISEYLSAAEGRVQQKELLDLSFDSSRELQAGPAIRKFLVQKNKTYIVTGGMGALGLNIMTWLAERGASSIVLCGRSAPNTSAQTAITRVRESGVVITVLAMDISELAAVKACIATIEEGLPQLAGVIHLAGVLDDGMLLQQSAERYSKVLTPKVKGVLNLHAATINLSLDFFVCFSSFSAILGFASQSNYAAANSFLDAFCYYRRKLGKPALSIDFGPWADVGMAAELSHAEKERMKRIGLNALGFEDNIREMENLLKFQVCHAGIFDVNWKRVMDSYQHPERRTLFMSFFETSERPTIKKFYEMLVGASRSERELMLLEKIKTLLAEITGMKNISQIENDNSVNNYGLNSLMSLDFKNNLQSELSVNLPTNLALKFPTPIAMAQHIMSLIDDSLSVGEAGSMMEVEEEESRVKELRLLSSQALFFEKASIVPEWGTIFDMWKYEGKFDEVAFKQSLKSIVDENEGLRASFSRDGEVWKQYIVADVDVKKCIVGVDCSSKVGDEQVEYIKNYLAGAAAEIDLSSSPLLRAYIFNRGSDKDVLVVLLFHHLILDGFSHNVLMTDFTQRYNEFKSTGTHSVSHKTSRLSEWINTLDYYVNNTIPQNEIEYWMNIPWEKTVNIPLDFPENKHLDTMSTTTHLRQKLTKSQTESLMKNISINLDIPLTNILMIAVSLVFTNAKPDRFFLISAIDFMRFKFPEIDMSRTLGWVSANRTLCIEAINEGTKISSLVEMNALINAIPNSGIDLELLAHYHNDVELKAKLNAFPSPEFLINYVGNFNDEIENIQSNKYAPDIPWLHPDNMRSEILACFCGLYNGELVLTWQYGNKIHLESSVLGMSNAVIDYLLSLVEESESMNTKAQRIPEN